MALFDPEVYWRLQRVYAFLVCCIHALAQNGIVELNQLFVETLFGRLKPLVQRAVSKVTLPVTPDCRPSSLGEDYRYLQFTTQSYTFVYVLWLEV